MGRVTAKKGCVVNHPGLFSEEEAPYHVAAAEKEFKSLRHPLWTDSKARLIREYIKLFTYITKHGAYIDGFAAPQRRERLDLCSAKLVLEAEPKRVRELWLCDIDPEGISILDELAAKHRVERRRVHVVPGDFNETVSEILSSGRIRETTAAFALLDQRTFECSWSTVEQLSTHKKTRKIEIFYFLATGWLDRSIAAVRVPNTAVRLDRWWGNPGWRSLQGMEGISRAKLVADRFKHELGYLYAYPYAIHNQARGGRTMYHMIHATDHPEASPLMIRAYRKISGRSEIELPDQPDLELLWRDLEEDGGQPGSKTLA
jgi:three-Cys-motif partner protein